MNKHTPEKKTRYQYGCVAPRDMEELEYIIDHMENITLDEFSAMVDDGDFNALQLLLGYSEALTIDKDWHVKFAKSSLPNGRAAYVLVHSSIEYVFY